MSHLICRFAPPSPQGEGVVLLARLVTPFKLTAPAIVIRRGVNEAENNPADCFLRAVVPKARSVRRAARRGNHRTGRRPLQRNGIILSTKPRQQVLSGARRCVHPRGVPLTLIAPAQVIRRAGLTKQKTIRRIVFCERSCPKQEAYGVRHDAGITEPDAAPYNGTVSSFQPNRASKCFQARAGACRIPVLTPKVYKHTPRG